MRQGWGEARQTEERASTFQLRKPCVGEPWAKVTTSPIQGAERSPKALNKALEQSLFPGFVCPWLPGPHSQAAGRSY